MLGSREQAERALAVRIDEYELGDPRFSPTTRSVASGTSRQGRKYRWPGELGAAAAESHGDLLRRVRQHRAVHPIPLHSRHVERRAEQPGGGAARRQALLRAFAKCINAQSMAAGMGVQLAVDPPPPAWQGADGTGQTVGIAAFDSFLLSDVDEYINLIGLPAARSPTSRGPRKRRRAARRRPGRGAARHRRRSCPSRRAPGSSVRRAVHGRRNQLPDAIQRHDQRRRGHHHQQLRLLREPDDAGRRAEHRDHPADGGRRRHQRLQRRGDTGSTCLDGSANTVACAGELAHATAVGGFLADTRPGPHIRQRDVVERRQRYAAHRPGRIRRQQILRRPAYQNGSTDSADPLGAGRGRPTPIPPRAW